MYQLPPSRFNSCRLEPCCLVLLLVVSQTSLSPSPQAALWGTLQNKFWLHYWAQPVLLSHGFQFKHHKPPMCMKISSFYIRVVVLLRNSWFVSPGWSICRSLKLRKKPFAEWIVEGFSKCKLSKKMNNINISLRRSLEMREFVDPVQWFTV